MSRRTPAAALALGLLAAPLLGGCGEPSTADYCSALTANQTKFAEMAEGSAAGLLTNLPMLHDLAEKAPDDLGDEWQTFLNALDGLEEALDAAGVSAEAFADGTTPAGLTVAEQKAISDAADGVSDEQVVASANGIEQQARDVCKVQLGL